MSLKTNYKDDIFEGSRLWRIIQNEDGTCTITDATTYTQRGDKFGQNDINAINETLNGLDAAVTGIATATLTVAGWSSSAGLYKQTVLVEGIAAEDMPLLLKYTAPDASKDDSTDYGIDFGLISGGQCAAGSVTFYAADTPDHDITVALALGKKGDGRLLLGGGGSGEKQQISNVVMTITDDAAVAEGCVVTATCNEKEWSSTIRNGKAKLYTSAVGNYTISVTATDGTVYTTVLVCPYFGQFSTDIYSGSLMVYGTEAGCSGKTCTVRSCDNDYNPTNNYDLTQTFDSTLELPFPGIPAGKYLITVDGKYVFFKEITSIQNINSVNVCLRQYLYNHGDQCMHNTGGWIKCKDEMESYVANNQASASITKNLLFLADSIAISGSIVCRPYSGGGKWFRGGGLVNANIGTVKPLFISATKYTSMQIVGADSSINYNIRTGTANDENTTTATATILQSGSGDSVDLRLNDCNAYIVIGRTLHILVINNYIDKPSDVNVSFSANIAEIYLV